MVITMKYYFEQIEAVLGALETSKEGLASSVCDTRLAGQGKTNWRKQSVNPTLYVFLNK